MYASHGQVNDLQDKTQAKSQRQHTLISGNDWLSNISMSRGEFWPRIFLANRVKSGTWETKAWHLKFVLHIVFPHVHYMRFTQANFTVSSGFSVSSQTQLNLQTHTQERDMDSAQDTVQSGLLYQYQLFLTERAVQHHGFVTPLYSCLQIHYFLILFLTTCNC